MTRKDKTYTYSLYASEKAVLTNAIGVLDHIGEHPCPGSANAVQASDRIAAVLKALLPEVIDAPEDE